MFSTIPLTWFVVMAEKVEPVTRDEGRYLTLTGRGTLTRATRVSLTLEPRKKWGIQAQTRGRLPPRHKAWLSAKGA